MIAIGRNTLQQFSALLLVFPSLLQAQSLNQPFTSSFSRLEHAACVSVFYRDGRLGCGTADRSISVGRLASFQEGAIVLNDNTKDDDNYVVVLEEFDLTANSMNTLLAAKNKGHLQGVLVVNSTYAEEDATDTSSSGLPSAEPQYPQGYNTPSANVNYGNIAYAWNSVGEGVSSLDLHGLPMAYVANAEVADSLRQESRQQQATRSIQAEFNYYMGPEDMNSIECLAWKDVSNGEWNPKCLPLGGQSVWALAGKMNQGSSNNQQVVLVAAGMDATSLFHDATPGGNAAASHILTILMAAKLVGEYTADNVDKWTKRIAFALFQGESYGFLGSRSFLRDAVYPGFRCNGNPVRSRAKDDTSEYGCLSPLRPSLRFASMGQVAGMLAVDQVGYAVSNGMLYAHTDEDDEYGAYLANLLKYSATSSFSVASSSVEDGDDGYAYPPSPLTSLLQLTEGEIGGAVLTGYDKYFTKKFPYNSPGDLGYRVDLDAIAAAATIVARTAVAAAYDNGNNGDDYATPTNYAKTLIPDLSSSDETLAELAKCFLEDGSCSLIKKYSGVEAANIRSKTGIDVGIGDAMATPPNYHVGVYTDYYGQPFVQVGDNQWGSYNGSDYGQRSTDAIALSPQPLEATIHGLLNDFLGRINNEERRHSCSKASDCSRVSACDGEIATCAGQGQCVCPRAHYHVALDEALRPADNMPAGYFVVDENNDAGISPMYTEPFWSSSVGIRVYRKVGFLPGIATLAVGLLVGGGSLLGSFVIRVALKKEKLY